jgi:hypothetical protein
MDWMIQAGICMILRKIGIFAAAVLFATASFADTLEVKENHPTKYVVQKGDTLWDISAKFLKKPWYWPKIWNVNPQVSDPHWIYPGDVLTLVWIDGKPYLQKENPTSTAKTAPVQTINADLIKSFLKHDLILPANKDELAKIPFILGHSDSHKLIAETSDVYVRGALNKGQQYGIYHKGQMYQDENGNDIGYRAEFVGVLMAGDQYETNLTKSLVVKNQGAIKIGDYVMPFNVDTGYNLYFIPKPATVDAVVVGLTDDGNLTGKYSTILLSKGSKDGVTTGDVFSLMRPGAAMAGRDASDIEYTTMASAGKQLNALRSNILPDDMIGQVMVYRTYEHVSLGIVMKTNDTISVGYKAIRP